LGLARQNPHLSAFQLIIDSFDWRSPVGLAPGAGPDSPASPLGDAARDSANKGDKQDNK